MTRWLILVPLVAFASCGGGSTNNPQPIGGPSGPSPTPTTCHAHNGLPDTSCNPGLASQATARCNGTKSVRPPVSYTNALKVKQIKEYGYVDTNSADYEEDHLVPLSLGGDPRDPRNLWPEPRFGPNNSYVKDRLEFKLYDLACHGSLDVPMAQKAIAKDWEALAERTP